MTISNVKPNNDASEPDAGPRTRASYAGMPDALLPRGAPRLRFRPITADDRERLLELFRRLSPESRRRRFLSPKHELTPREVTYLTAVDHVCHEAIAAVDQRDGSIVGVARYAAVGDQRGVADVAVAVADELQSLGIGTALAGRVVERARTNGFTLLTATTLRENRPARALLARLGFRARTSHGGEIDLDLELEVASTWRHRCAPDSIRPDHVHATA